MIYYHLHMFSILNPCLKRFSISLLLSLLLVLFSAQSFVIFASEPSFETKTFYIQTDTPSSQTDKKGKDFLKPQKRNGREIIVLKDSDNQRTSVLANDALILLNFPGVDPTSEVTITPAKGVVEKAPGKYYLSQGTIGALKTVGKGTATITIKAKKRANKNNVYAASSTYNWAGYARITGAPFTNITSFWKVPQVSCGMSNAYLGSWVGIDGANNGDLIQTGTASDCLSGTATYYAWWEILPAASQTITGNSVVPGDTMFAQINKNTSNWTITIKNLTQNWSFSTTQTYSGAQSSAEWIVEPPTIGGTISPLADFGTMSFFNNTQNSINPNHSYATDSINMLDQSNNVISTPSTPSASLDAFSVSYGSVAPTPPSSWTATGLTNYARFNSASAKLSSGKVYLTGGEGSNPSPNCYNFVDEYNPTTNTWASKATMIQRRYNHTANVVTTSGGERLLVVGGRGPNGYPGDYLKSAELYNPSTNTWTYTGNDMSTYHMNHTATTLSSGKVLVVGGYDNYGVRSSAVDLYDPINNSWSVAATISASRVYHSATLLNNGRVFVIGGQMVQSGSPVATKSAILYDPGINSWSSGPNLNTARSNHKATLLSDGRVLVTGGYDSSGNTLSSAEIWSPSTNTWTTVSPMFYRRRSHTATLLSDGRVFVAGGTGGILGASNVAQTSSEVYDPATDKWTLLPAMLTARTFHTADLLDDGKILMTNGSTGSSPLDKAEYFTP